VEEPLSLTGSIKELPKTVSYGYRPESIKLSQNVMWQFVSLKEIQKRPYKAVP
jgi:hypothetical protein